MEPEIRHAARAGLHGLNDDGRSLRPATYHRGVMSSITTPTNTVRLDGLIESLRAISNTDDPTEIGRHAGRGIRYFLPFDALVSVSVRDLPPGRYKVTRRMIGNRPVRESVNPWRDWALLETCQDGLIGEAIGRARPRVWNDLYLRNDPALGDDFSEFGSCLATPLFDGGEALNWNFIFRTSPEGFAPNEVELMVLVSNLLGQATRNMVTARKVEELNARITSQLHEVAELQRSLLPQRLPDFPQIEMVTHYQPCEQAGGDYYDFAQMTPEQCAAAGGSGCWGAIIADVAGHGARAAVIMAMMQSIVHAYPITPRLQPDLVLEHLNAQLLAKGIDRSFVTALCLSYDPHARTLRLASAGHYPPRLKKPGPESPVTALHVDSGLPLGIERDVKYEVSTAQLEVGDTLVLYTDGVIESFNAKREMFGLGRLDAALHHCSGEPGCVVESVTTALREHESGLPAADDQTLLVMKVRG